MAPHRYGTRNNRNQRGYDNYDRRQRGRSQEPPPPPKSPGKRQDSSGNSRNESKPAFTQQQMEYLHSMGFKPSHEGGSSKSAQNNTQQKKKVTISAPNSPQQKQKVNHWKGSLKRKNLNTNEQCQNTGLILSGLDRKRKSLRPALSWKQLAKIFKK